MSDTASNHSASTGSTTLSHLKPRPLNFSRPRPTQTNSSSRLQHDKIQDKTQDKAQELPNNVRSISAFHQPAPPPPPPRDEQRLRYSMESNETTSTDTTDTTTSTDTTTDATPNSAGSEFAWDGKLGELRSIRPPQGQRSEYSSGHARSATSGSAFSSSTAAGSDQPFIAELPGSEPPPRPTTASTVPDDAAPPPIPSTKMPRIIQRTSIDQQSERASSIASSSVWEDTASHHTMSEYGDGPGGGSLRQQSSAGASSEDNNGERGWKASNYDTSGLSEAEIKKLKKKGINPALYAEMKAARKGKGKWISPLVGNTYLG